MEHVLPSDVRSALGREQAPGRRRSPGLFAISAAITGAQRHPVVELTETRMVIRAENMPHLRGFVDIVKGEERIGRHLVVLSWARDGLAGYDFKRHGRAGAAPADYERPAHAALLGGPGDGR
ncbi:hypothetical protein M1105_14395 [Limibaculum sp. FT325]|uniref:hypothetical protein n=1 Tax=Thermohalobaculum sediminis TaxID=2939436 RepID=UPI0020C05E82|nr:hypothetical protein [Limibaculum sediminis]MCL5778170.1 hypothetical protein [Limibaculum sediminis]